MPFGHISDWYLTQCPLLWPEKYTCWLRFGWHIGRAVPSMNAQHFSSGAPFLLTALKKAKNLSSFTLPMNYFELAVARTVSVTYVCKITDMIWVIVLVKFPSRKL